jgi:hypothetical protein
MKYKHKQKKQKRKKVLKNFFSLIVSRPSGRETIIGAERRDVTPRQSSTLCVVIVASLRPGPKGR